MAIRLDRKRAVSLASLITVVALAGVAQACGGGSASIAATPTARPLPSRVAGGSGSRLPFNGTPQPNFTPGAFGTPGARAFFGGFNNSETADFFGISEDELRSELQADGATLGSVAEAHGKTRDELKTFLTDQLRKNTEQAVSDGRMTQDQADSMLQDMSSRVDDMIDGALRMGGPPNFEATPSQ